MLVYYGTEQLKPSNADRPQFKGNDRDSTLSTTTSLRVIRKF